MEPSTKTRPLRFWWVAPAFAILLMLGAWAWHERPRVEFGGTEVDTRFLTTPRATLEPRESGRSDAWLALDWRSSHDARIRWSEVDLLVNGAAPRYVARDPGPGEWSAIRDDVYLGATQRVREGDVIAIGTDAPLEGARVQVVVDPCDCTASSVVLRAPD